MDAAAVANLPQRGFWLSVLFVDLLILLLLPKVIVLFPIAGILVLALASLKRPEWILAFMLTGTPLVGALPPDSVPGSLLIYGIRIMLVIGVIWGCWQVRPDGRGSPTGLGLGSVVSPVLRDSRTWIALGLLAVLMIGLQATPSPRYGGGKTFSFLLLPVFLYLAGALMWPLWSTPGRLDRLLRVSLLLGGLVVACGLAVALGADHEFLRANQGGGLYRSGGRLAWLGSNVIWMARVLAVWIVLLLWAASRNLVRPAVAVLLVIAGLYLMLRTGSRGPLLALLLSPLGLLLLPKAAGPATTDRTTARAARSRRSRTWGLAAAVVLLAVGALALTTPEQKASLTRAVGRGTFGTMLRVVGIDTASLGGGQLAAADPSSTFRLQIAQRGLEQMREGLPWGHGTGAFSTVLFGRDFRIYPHNAFVETLFENGLPGLLLLLLFILLSWRGAIRLSRHSPAGRWLWVLLMMALLNAQVSGDLPANELIWLWGGMIVALQIGASRGRSEPRHAG